MRLLQSFSRVRPDFALDTVQVLAELPPTPTTRWVIGGMMGSGKSWLAGRLAASWGIPHVEIDLFPSPEAITRSILALPAGWVAEANPWQVPEAVWSCADWSIFLDFDNLVNYWRLLRRGLARWASSGQFWYGLRKHLLQDAFKDWYRLVYLYGESNRNGWRVNGMGGSLTAPERCLRCISPREAELLVGLIESFRLCLIPKHNLNGEGKV